MAVVITQEAKKRRMLLGLFVILVLGTIAVLYFGVFNKSQPNITVLPAEIGTGQPPPAGNVSGEVVATPPPVAELKTNILEDERFKNLQASPGIPIEVGTPGKSNPFSD